MLSLLRTLRRNIGLLTVGMLIVGFCVLMGWIFFVRGQEVMADQLRERLRSIAVSAAVAFRSLPLEELQSAEDIRKPVYADAIDLLNIVRAQNTGVAFAYILRPTADPRIFAFVADADSLRPFDSYDLNGDGIIDAADEQAPPGTAYDVTDIPEISRAVTDATTTAEPYADQWGQFMSAFAPVRSADGRFQGVLGIDMDISRFTAMSQSIFSPIAFLLFLVAGASLASYIIIFLWNRRMESLERLDAERRGLLLMAFHQLGSPLTILKWNFEALMTELDQKGERSVSLEQHITNMEDGITRMDNILQSLSRADQVQEGRISYQPRVVSLESIILRVVREVQPRLERHRQMLSLELDPDVDVRVDPSLIAGVLREIIGNAIDFSDPASTIVLRTRRDEASVQVEVQDRGCGIPQEDIARLFQKFARAGNAQIMKPSGSGLGLYISRGLIERAGGKLWLESAVGKGTTVTFVLPIARK